MGNTGRSGEDSQGWAYGVPKQIKGVRLELGTEKVIETKQGSVTVVTPSQLGTPVTPVMSLDLTYYSGSSS